MERGNVGYKRVIIIAVIGTATAIILDYFGIINRIAKVIP
jgi:hypothetical protein